MTSLPTDDARSANPNTVPHGNEPEAISDAELHDYIRRNLLKGAIGLIGLVGLLAFVGEFFEAELLVITTWVYQKLGFAGLAGILMVTDSFITPVPPDVLLVVIAKSDLAAMWGIVVPTLGLFSSLAGMIGWSVSRRIGDTALPRRIFGRFYAMNAALVKRYGTIAVALGALTPIPFSITCWTAGVFRMPFRSIAWITLLRVPRFVGYYLLIVWSVNLF